VIAPSFADIFRSNCLRTGLVPVRLDHAAVQRLMRAVAADPATKVTVDVAAGRVRAPSAGIDAALDLDDAARTRLALGLDDIAVTLRAEAEIAAYEGRRAGWLPRTPVPAGRGAR